jgi:hypothetical protein
MVTGLKIVSAAHVDESGSLLRALGTLVLPLACWPGNSKADPPPAVNWSDCRIAVRHSMGERGFSWEERYYATVRCGSDKPKAKEAKELRVLSVGTSTQGSIFAQRGACYLEEPIKKGVTYPCVIETSAYCVGNERRDIRSRVY